MTLSFRAHHFLCAFCFQGKGYSPAFIENFSMIMAQLTDDTLIEVVAETDSICSPCPHRREKLCTSQEKILRLDNAHAQLLKIRAGENVTWGEAKKRILQHMSLEAFHQACESCEWKELGICEKVLLSNRK